MLGVHGFDLRIRSRGWSRSPSTTCARRSRRCRASRARLQRTSLGDPTDTLRRDDGRRGEPARRAARRRRARRAHRGRPLGAERPGGRLARARARRARRVEGARRRRRGRDRARRPRRADDGAVGSSRAARSATAACRRRRLGRRRGDRDRPGHRGRCADPARAAGARPRRADRRHIVEALGGSSELDGDRLLVRSRRSAGLGRPRRACCAGSGASSVSPSRSASTSRPRSRTTTRRSAPARRADAGLLRCAAPARPLARRGVGRGAR